MPPRWCNSYPATGDEQESTTVTLLFANDKESAHDSIPGFWRHDQAVTGEIAGIKTLINSIRECWPNVFLFDSGDTFTGILAKLT